MAQTESFEFGAVGGVPVPGFVLRNALGAGVR